MWMDKPYLIMYDFFFTNYLNNYSPLTRWSSHNQGFSILERKHEKSSLASSNKIAACSQKYSITSSAKKLQSDFYSTHNWDKIYSCWLQHTYFSLLFRFLFLYLVLYLLFPRGVDLHLEVRCWRPSCCTPTSWPIIQTHLQTKYKSKYISSHFRAAA